MNGTRNSRPARKLLTAALASCLVLGAAPLMAQTTGATIRGKVMADSAPAASAQVVVVNKAMADKFWPGQDPLGKRLAPGTSSDWWQVIGVIGDVRSYGLAARTPFEMYRTIEQQPCASMSVVMRTTMEFSVLTNVACWLEFKPGGGTRTKWDASAADV